MLDYTATHFDKTSSAIDPVVLAKFFIELRWSVLGDNFEPDFALKNCTILIMTKFWARFVLIFSWLKFWNSLNLKIKSVWNFFI